jgi:hypothetical protein
VSMEQTAEKKAVSLSFVNTVANASYIYTPCLYPKSDGPKYLTPMAPIQGCIWDHCCSVGVEDLVDSEEQEDQEK